MSCPFSLCKCLCYKHQSLPLPLSWEQSGVCPGWASLTTDRESGPHPLGQGQGGQWPMAATFIHFFSCLKLHFFLIVLSTNCSWLYWQVDWIKFDDPQKSFLGKWCLRRRWKKVRNLLSIHAKCHVSHLFLVSISVNVGKAEVIMVQAVFSEAWFESSPSIQ